MNFRFLLHCTVLGALGYSLGVHLVFQKNVRPQSVMVLKKEVGELNRWVSKHKITGGKNGLISPKKLIICLKTLGFSQSSSTRLDRVVVQSKKLKIQGRVRSESAAVLSDLFGRYTPCFSKWSYQLENSGGFVRYKVSGDLK